MTTEEFQASALAELTAIRKLLEQRPAAPATNSRSGQSSGQTAGEQAPIPQPSEWYAQDSAPRLDSSGKPYPERPQERALKNAARQLFHQRKGTLSKVNSGAFGAQQDRVSTPSGGSSSPAVDDGDSVPFLRRDFDHG